MDLWRMRCLDWQARDLEGALACFTFLADMTALAADCRFAGDGETLVARYDGLPFAALSFYGENAGQIAALAREPEMMALAQSESSLSPGLVKTTRLPSPATSGWGSSGCARWSRRAAGWRQTALGTRNLYRGWGLFIPEGDNVQRYGRD